MATAVTAVPAGALVLPRPFYDPECIREAARVHGVEVLLSPTKDAVEVRIGGDGTDEARVLEFLNAALGLTASRAPFDDEDE
jgi:hypothetical protein